MSLLTKETDLLQFINKKKQDKIDVSFKKIITNYSKVITNSIIKSYEKLCIAKYSIICLETIDNLFWILFLYSKNLKLTMFLCDRAILLFNEYILMTNSNIITDTNKNNVQLIDVKTFVYKKTIGPLIINNLNFKNHTCLIKTCYLFKNLYSSFIIYFIKNNDDVHLDITNEITTILDTLFNNYFDVLLEESISNNIILINLLDEFIELEIFYRLSIDEKYLALFILIKLYKCEYLGIDNINNNKETQLIIKKNIEKYYKLIFKIAKEMDKKNTFKKEFLNIKVNDFYKLLETYN